MARTSDQLGKAPPSAERLGKSDLVPYLVGPTGLALGYGDEAALAKAKAAKAPVKAPSTK